MSVKKTAINICHFTFIALFHFQKLKFEMCAPTPIHFLRRFSKAAQANAKTHRLSKYIIELAAIDYNLSECSPSEVSYSFVFRLPFCALDPLC